MHKTSFWVVLAIALYLLSDTLLELLIECLHTSFELVEFALDLLVEHVFNTDRHTSQMIAFYLMLLITAVSLYKLIRRLPDWSLSAKNYLAGMRHRIVRSFRGYWDAIPALNKITGWTVMALGVGLTILGLLL